MSIRTTAAEAYREALPVVAVSAVGGLFAGVISGVLLTLAVVGVVFIGHRRGINPDTLAGPVVTTTGDVVGIATMLFAARVVLALGGG